MSAILELKETPKSCWDCPVITTFFEEEGCSQTHYCTEMKDDECVDVSEFAVSRHPDCPLKITEDNLRWKTFEYVWYRCPLCRYETGLRDANYCPSCGIKLLPPKGGE